MTSLDERGWLPDVNVWLALCFDRHEDHAASKRWLEIVRTPVYFCRVTQMGLLRLLTNPQVMGTELLTPAGAISIYKDVRADERVRYAHEPSDTERLWLSLMTIPSAKGSVWTDAWLAAFAISHRSRLVSFDKGMRRWTSLEPEILA